MIGPGISRTEGPLKVTGRARYSHERQEAGEALHAFVLGAAIAKGRIADIETAGAEASPGVRLVLTHRNAPAQTPYKEKSDLFDPHPQLHDDRVTSIGMPVALVVADTWEAARSAAGLITVSYEAAPAVFDLAAGVSETPEWRDVSAFGDVDTAMARAVASVDATYTTPYHTSQPMELHACIADWRDGKLTVWLAGQMVNQIRDGLAETLLLDVDQISVDSAFVGGGFGSKIALHPEAVLASMAARELGRPVKLMMTRRQVFNLVGHRPASISRVRLAADAEGRLTAIGHDTHLQVTQRERWNEGVAMVSRSLYAAPNRLTRQSHVILDVGAGEPVRGPGEVPGLLVFESAMDELANELGIDPLELRLRNDTQIDPEKQVPLSGRRLAECLRSGAEQFGWSERPKEPATRRDGDWLIGYGLASSIRGHFQTRANASVRLDPAGYAVVKSDMTDIGTGTYTIVAQIAAEALGIGIDQVRVELARSELPRGEGSGGSWGASNTSVSTDRACKAALKQIEAVAGVGYNDLFAEVKRHFPDGIEASGHIEDNKDDPNYQNFSLYTYGATFTEVGVHAYTAETRIRRMLGVFSCGRIINAKTARSQLIGGMIWGIGAALHEGAHVDPNHGAWVNGDLAEYLIPVHADVPAIEALMLDDFDERANHLGIKGIGELGAGGTAAAIANAVYNATGVRVRNFPISIAKLLPGLPALG